MIASVLSSAEAQTLAIVAGAVICGTPVVIWRKLRKEVVEPLKSIPEIKHDIAIVKAEVFANHGSSLRDSVNRNEVITRAVAEVVGIDPDSIVPPGPGAGPLVDV